MTALREKRNRFLNFEDISLNIFGILNNCLNIFCEVWRGPLKGFLVTYGAL